MQVSSPAYSSFAGVFGCVAAAGADGDGEAGCTGFCCAAYKVTAHKDNAARTIHFMVGQRLCTGDASYSIE
jgi:hypothetical protein